MYFHRIDDVDRQFEKMVKVFIIFNRYIKNKIVYPIFYVFFLNGSIRLCFGIEVFVSVFKQNRKNQGCDVFKFGYNLFE